MKEKIFITTDNIFADLGLKNAEELRARSDLMSEVVTIIRNSGLSQKEIAEILKISAPKVSALMTGKIVTTSVMTHLSITLTLLGCNVEIRVLPQRRISRSMKRGRVKVKRPVTRRKRSKTARRSIR